MQNLLATEKQNLYRLLAWLEECDSEIYSLSIGHSRETPARQMATELSLLWQSSPTWVRPEGGSVLRTVDWPETAASWLRPAQRFARPVPGNWVVLGDFASWLPMSQRLAAQPGWDAAKTFALFSNDAQLLAHSGWPAALEGLRGLLTTGSRWEVAGGKCRVAAFVPDTDQSQSVR